MAQTRSWRQEMAGGSPFRPSAQLLLAISHRLAGETDQADDVLADVADEGLGLGASDAVTLALGQRAAMAIDREAWVQAEELADRALLVTRRSRLDEYPTSAFVYALAARVALHRGAPERAHEFLARAQRLRPRLTYALPYLSVQTRLELARATSRSPTPAAPRRCCARSSRYCADNQTWAHPSRRSCEAA